MEYYDKKENKNRFQNFLISFILIGYYASACTLLVFGVTERRVLPLTVAFSVILVCVILHKTATKNVFLYISPSLVSLFFLTCIIFANCPNLTSGLDEAFYFVALTLIPCIYLYLSDIKPNDFKQIFKISSFFFYVLICVAIYSYLRVGTLDMRVTSQESSGLYEIGVSRHLAIAVFVGLYLTKAFPRTLRFKLYSYLLICLSTGLILFTGKRQAMLSVILSPLLILLIDPRRPWKLIVSLSSVVLALLFLYYFFIPYTLQSDVMKGTRMANYLEEQYYNQENIRSMSGRIGAYKTALRVTAENPVLGVGFKNFGHYTKKRFNLRDESGNPHNLWLSILAELGIVGFAFAMILFLSFIKNLSCLIWKSRLSGYADEIIAACRMGICVLLFSMVGFDLGRGVLLFFIMPLFLEKLLIFSKDEGSMRGRQSL
jgi:O-antigen ligase